MAAALGRRGGRARAARLSAAERKDIASLGGKARRASLEAARRIAHNFYYVDLIDELRQARRSPVQRLSTCDGLLPGIYRRR